MNEPSWDDDLPLWDSQEVHLWMLKSLLILKTRNFGQRPGTMTFDDSREVIEQLLNVEDSRDEEAGTLKEIAPTELVRMLHAAENECSKSYTSTPSVIDENLKKLGVLLDLCDTELAVVKFWLIRGLHERLRDASSYLIELGINQMHRVLADILGLSSGGVQDALRLDGNLRRCGFIDSGAFEFTFTVDYRMVEALLYWPLDLRLLYGAYFRLANRATFSMTDFSFLGVRLDTLQQLVESAVRQRKCGVNILIYGVPGTGKTELCRALSHAIGCDSYEIVRDTLEGKPLSGPERFRAYALCQRALRANGKTLVVFDEIEDAFRDGWGSFIEYEKIQKAWVNCVLEQNPLPAIWVTNDLAPINKASLQRFSYSMELAPPPATQKRTLLNAALKGIDGADQIAERAAGWEDLTPADIDRTGRVIRMMSLDGQTPPSPVQIIDILCSRPDGPDPAR